MKILHINSYDIHGGAARAVYRLHKGLLSIKCDSIMLTKKKRLKDNTIKSFEIPKNLSNRIRRWSRRRQIIRAYNRYKMRPKGYELFSVDFTEYGKSIFENLPLCDLVNLHWISGFIDYYSFLSKVPKKIPVVWTLHDMNPFTGGCHYDHGCGRYMKKCGACPQLGSKNEYDLSYKILRRKIEAVANIPEERLKIVALNHWMADLVRKSEVLGKFPVTIIPNGIDTNAFIPYDKSCAKKVLGINEKDRVILFVAHSVMNRRKGFMLMEKALRKVKANNLFVLSIGKGQPEIGVEIPHLHLGEVNNDRFLVTIFNAADLFIIPSLQDNLPNTVLESMACGTPIVGFNVGGIPEMVRSEITGALVPPGDVTALATTIDSIIGNQERLKIMAAECRKNAIEEYSLESQGYRYLKLYQSMLDDK